MLYDTSYRVPYDLEPGQMVYSPTNAPHRVENEDCLNISLTLDFLTEPIRRAQIVTLANGLLRHRFGWQPHSRSTQGPSYWAKAVLQKALRKLFGYGRRGLLAGHSSSDSTAPPQARSSI